MEGSTCSATKTQAASDVIYLVVVWKKVAVSEGLVLYSGWWGNSKFHNAVTPSIHSQGGDHQNSFWRFCCRCYLVCFHVPCFFGGIQLSRSAHTCTIRTQSFSEPKRTCSEVTCFYLSFRFPFQLKSDNFVQLITDIEHLKFAQPLLSLQIVPTDEVNQFLLVDHSGVTRVVNIGFL